MMKDILQLAKMAATRTPIGNFSVETVDTALREELKKSAGNINQFMKNRYDIYEIVIEGANEKVQADALKTLGSFADIQFVEQGQKAKFRTPLSRSRAKKYLTQASAAGVYRTFRLDSSTFEVPVSAQGIAAIIDFERMLDGVESFAESLSVIVEALSDSVYLEVYKALQASSTKNLPEANRVTDSSYDAKNLEKLCNIVKTYSDNNQAVIFATPEFISAMGADAVPVGQGHMTTEADLMDIRNYGGVTMFRGNIIVPLKQAYTDFNNTETLLDPSTAFVLPSSREKLVKVAIEGGTQIYDFTNRDLSMEIHAYHKIGASLVTTNAHGVYVNTSLKA